MSWFLYRLGRGSFRHKWIVLVTWIVVLVGMGVAAASLRAPTVDSFTLPGLESTKAFDLIKERAPQASLDTATAQIIFQAPEGKTISDFKSQIADDLNRVKTDEVQTIVDPFAGKTISPNGRAGYANVTYKVLPQDASDATINALASISSKGSADSLLVASSAQFADGAPEGSATEVIGVVVALIVLVLTLGTLLAAGMSLLTALIGVGVGVLGVTAATGIISIGSTTPLLATMLGLAVGIDYALFIFSRYRHEIAIGRTPEEAAGRAVGTAGTAVVFAGTTVVIALVGLSIVNIRFLSEMGIAAAATVVVAVLIAITLLPAVFGFVKARVMQSRLPGLRKLVENEGESHGLGFRWASFITKHRIKTFVVGVVFAGVLIIPVFSLQLAVPDNATAAPDSDARIAYDLIADNFGPGANGPLVIVVDTTNATDKVAAVNSVNVAVEKLRGDVAQVIPAGSMAKSPAEFAGQLQAVNFAEITIIPKTGPSDLETKNLVAMLRKDFKPVAAQTNTTIYVSGQTAVGVDISRALLNAFPKYLVVVVGLAFLLLMAVFRSILVPLKAVVGFLISIGMAIGLTVAVTQWGWAGDLLGINRPAPVMFLLPLLLTGILFGLAMDYELFLVSRMREEYVHGASARNAIVQGFSHSSRVVTAAAIVMFSVFGSFALLPDQIIKTIGFGLAVGVLADAFLVRMTLVPAFMALLGDKMWWFPKWLDRIVPKFDIEGEELTKRLDSPSPTS